jgi:hypothetical protein
MKKHQKVVSTLNKEKSALAKHICDPKHQIASGNSRVITTNNRHGHETCFASMIRRSVVDVVVDCVGK